LLLYYCYYHRSLDYSISCFYAAPSIGNVIVVLLRSDNTNTAIEIINANDQGSIALDIFS
jgi:hypothetical protein